MKLIDLLDKYRGIMYELELEIRGNNYFKYSIKITDIDQLPEELKGVDFDDIIDWFIEDRKKIVFNLDKE